MHRQIVLHIVCLLSHGIFVASVKNCHRLNSVAEAFEDLTDEDYKSNFLPPENKGAELKRFSPRDFSDLAFIVGNFWNIFHVRKKKSYVIIVCILFKLNQHQIEASLSVIFILIRIIRYKYLSRDKIIKQQNPCGTYHKFTHAISQYGRIFDARENYHCHRDMDR